MGIWTIVKANIRAHKTQFISLILLTVFCVASVIAFYNVNESSKESILYEYDCINVADECLVVERSDFTEEMEASFANAKGLKDYTVTPSLGIHSIYLEGWDTNDKSLVYQSTCELIAQPTDESKFHYPQITENMSKNLGIDYEVKEGEIYLSNGLATQIKAGVGDRIVLSSENVQRVFTIGGIIEDPFAAVSIGYKILVVNEKDYEDFYNEVTSTFNGMGFEREYNHYYLGFYAEDGIEKGALRRNINDASGIYDIGIFSMNKDEFLYYNNLLVFIFSSILIAVACVLYIVLIVIIGNTITSAVRDNYKELGILKANGFSGKQLKQVYILQYVIVEAIGIILGIIVGYFLCGVLLRAFAQLAGYVLVPHLNLLVTGLIIAGVLIVSCLVIYICTIKVSGISPYKAISMTGDDVNFSDRLSFPIAKKTLTFNIALRQLTSKKKQYLGLMISSLILMILLVFAQGVTSSMGSKSTVLSMGVTGELQVGHFGRLSEEEREEIRDIIKEYTNIQQEIVMSARYTSCEFGDIQTAYYENVDSIKCNIYEGREPIYDNEMAVGCAVANSFDKKIGDTMELTYNGKSFEYLITGYINTTIDLGKVCAMTYEASKHIGLDETHDNAVGMFLLENTNKPNEWYPREDAKIIADAIQERCDVNASAPNMDVFGSSDITLIISLVKYVIDLVAIIVISIIIAMNCSKCFANEVKQLGVYKAMGFSSGKIRLQFAFRFAIVFTIGGLVGGILASILVTPAFGAIFGIVGAPRMAVQLEPGMFILPLIIIGIVSFISAYIASRRIKKVDINVLVTE